MDKNKEDWNYYQHIWKTEAAYLTWVRGQIRQIWNSCPQKREFLKKNVKQLPKLDANGAEIKFKNGKTRLYKAFICNRCLKTCYDSDSVGRIKTYAVDHIKGNHTLTRFEHTSAFLEAMIRVREEDLQILCTECHSIKSYSEKYEMSFEEAEIHKKAIDLIKNKKDKDFFIKRNLEIPSNAVKRRQAIIDYLKNDRKNK